MTILRSPSREITRAQNAAGSRPFVASHNIGLGVIVPSANTVLERDYPRIGNERVSFYFTRILNAEDTAEQLAGMKTQADAAASLLTHTRKCAAIAFACTSGSFLEGRGYDDSIVSLMKETAGVPCVTTAGCVVEAFRHLDIRRPHVFTPYEQWLSQRSVTFLEAHGFEVSGHGWGFDLALTDPTDRFEPINDWIASELAPEADAIFISCTNFTWLRGIDALERRTGIPVVTSNLATLWGLSKAAGVSESISVSARLFNDQSAENLRSVL